MASLIGGAIGDALGAPIEFYSLAQIRSQYGKSGVTTFEAGSWGEGRITDDTQMMLFTIEAIIRSYMREQDFGIVDFGTVVHHSYLRWLITQDEQPPSGISAEFKNGHLLDRQELHHRRSPGDSCLSALRTAIEPPSPDTQINNSKGCGGLMRVAPVGVFMPDAFGLGVTAAAITHGHPTGYLCAGFFAHVLEKILRHGADLEEAIDSGMRYLVAYYDESVYKEVVMAVHAALQAAEKGERSPEAVESLGAGWVAGEALSIALYCALVADSYREGVLLSVNHSGDSDSTGMLAGNLLGAMYGMEAIPAEWIENVECGDLIEEMVFDALLVSSGDVRREDQERLFAKYPPS